MEGRTTARTLRRRRWWKTHSEKKKSGHGKQPGEKVSAVVAGTKDQSNQATSAKRDSFSGDEEEKEYSSPTVTSMSEKPTGGSIQPKRRYILFVGHLPYEATAEDIVEHFEKRGVQVKNLRLLTKKETGKSRGIAFVEFDSPKMMQIGLKLHGTRLKGRRINVEVTCGGGGKGQERKEKIKERNEKLHQKKKHKKHKISLQTYFF